MCLSKMTKLFLLGPVLVGLAVVASSVLARNRLDQQFAGDHFATITSSLSAQFTPAHDGLNIVILEGKNPGLTDTSEFVFTLSGADGQTVRRLVFSGRNFGDPGAVRLQFDPLTSSSGQRLTARVDVVSPSVPTAQFLVDSANQLAVRVYYRLSGPGAGISQLAKNWWSLFKSDPGFFGGWLGVLVSLWLLSGPFRIPGGRRL